jgi:hypothetical protein
MLVWGVEAAEASEFSRMEFRGMNHKVSELQQFEITEFNLDFTVTETNPRKTICLHNFSASFWKSSEEPLSGVCSPAIPWHRSCRATRSRDTSFDLGFSLYISWYHVGDDFHPHADE